MKIFPVPKIIPQIGILEARIFENAFVNIPPKLSFQITIPLSAFELTGEPNTQNTAIVLDWIIFGIQKLSDFENRTFHFPINPEAGYIDGAIYLFDVHNPVDVTALCFGKIENQAIFVEATFRIDFEYEGTGYAKTKFIKIKTQVAFGELLIWNDMLEPTEDNLKLAKNFVSQFIDTEGFGESYLDGFGIKMKMQV